MAQSESTCWSVIEAAAGGSSSDKGEFARRYGPVVRTYLAARWRSSACLRELDDAVQEIFVECFKENGLLVRAERERPGGFRAFLYGAARNVARRFEANRSRNREQSPPSDVSLSGIPADEPSLSLAFDRAWAMALLREAARIQEEHARSAGDAALRRVELLRLRFYEGKPIREIAALWEADPAVLHHVYAKARREFKDALMEVVAFHSPGPPASIEKECATILELLG